MYAKLYIYFVEIPPAYRRIDVARRHLPASPTLDRNPWENISYWKRLNAWLSGQTIAEIAVEAENHALVRLIPVAGVANAAICEGHSPIAEWQDDLLASLDKGVLTPPRLSVRRDEDAYAIMHVVSTRDDAFVSGFILKNVWPGQTSPDGSSTFLQGVIMDDEASQAQVKTAWQQMKEREARAAMMRPVGKVIAALTADDGKVLCEEVVYPTLVVDS